MQNDLVVNNFGFAVDDISIPEINWSDDAETADGQWSPEGFIRIHNRIPQVWSVRAVEQNEDGSILVRELEVTDGTGTLNVDLRT